METPADQIQLPLLRADDTIDLAIESMLSAHVSASVVERAPNDWRVYFNTEILAALQANLKRLGDLPDNTRPVLVIEKSPTNVRSRLELAGRSYLASRSAGLMITVMARSKDLVAEIQSAIKVCRCSACDHFGSSPPDHDGEACDCGKGTIQCF